MTTEFYTQLVHTIAPTFVFIWLVPPIGSKLTQLRQLMAPILPFTKIHRDILSHDITESSIMHCVKSHNLEIYEGFPGTALEWQVRQSRWDRGDLILCKYLFPWTFGLTANLLSGFSNSACIPFYSSFSTRPTVHTGTFNARVIIVRTFVFMAAMIYTYLEGNALFLVVFSMYNAEIVLLPFLVKLATGTPFYNVVALTLHDIYIGAVDIYYGTARTLRALADIGWGIGGWKTFCDEGHSPFVSMLVFCRLTAGELMVAICTMIYYVRKSFDENGHHENTYLLVTIWLGLVACHPLYIFVTAHKV